MMPWQGLALISRLPQPCVNRQLVVVSCMVEPPQVRPAPSISATASLASIWRTVGAPSLFSARFM